MTPPARSRPRPLLSFVPLALALVAGAGCLSPDGDDEPSLATTAQALINERNPTIATGTTHSCVVEADATVSCWGRNNYGQLGNGTTTSSPTPVTVVGIADAVAVTAGNYHSCAVRAGGTAVCWGRGNSGQLGGFWTVDSHTPTAVSSLTGITSLSAGGSHTCATLESGQARCWGSNAFGQLGNASLTAASTPRVVGTISRSGLLPMGGIAEVEAGTSFTCARMTAGGVRCWGRNNFGQLGDGTTTQRTTPVAVATLTGAFDLAVGDNHACAATGVGRASCWGFNLMGQLGDGTQQGRSTPVEVQRRLTSTLTFPIVNVTSITAGQYHTCLRSLGEVWCTGNNDFGQLAMDTTGQLELLAKKSNPAVAATELAAGGEHTCVRRPGGSIVCFGRDNHGQVGDQGRCPTTPTATLTSVLTPGAGQVRKDDARGDIYYTDGNDLELTVETTACAQVSQVNFKWGPIEPDDPIEPSDGLQYEIVSTTDRTDGVREIKLHIGFQNGGTGATYPVAVQLTSPAGNSTSVGFTLVEVLEANPTHSGKIDIGRDEILNEVLQAMHAKFGDGNYWDRNGVNFYDFDYAHFSLELTSDGVAFQAKTKADLIPGNLDDNFCNPTANVWGTFKVVPDGENVVTQWTNGAGIFIDWPNGCQVASLGLLDLIGIVVAVVKDAKVEEKVAKRVAELSERCPPEYGGCLAVLQSIAHEAGRIRVTVHRLFDSVTFRQPYLSSQLGAGSVGDPMRRGLALPPSEGVLIVAGGIAEACGTQACEAVNHSFGSTGLFNWNWEPRSHAPTGGEPWGAHPPILDPWPCGPLGCASHAGRQAAWLRQQGLRRELAAMPMPSRNVGALLARVLRSDDDGNPSNDASSLKFAGDYICGLASAGGNAARLVVGRNDIPGGPLAGEYGRGDAVVTVVFLVAPGSGGLCSED